jgi:type I restriction enzyme S subunit
VLQVLGWTANQHILRVIPADKNMAGYLYIWLASPYGVELIKHNTYGSTVDEITDGHMLAVVVPLLADKQLQTRINQLALDANAKRYEAYQLEQEALRIMNDDVIYAK